VVAFCGALVAEKDLMGLASIFWRFVDFRSHFTATHTSGVVAIVQQLAGLCGLDGAATRKIAIAAALHDLGKLSVPAETLEKAGPLSSGEWEVMRHHPSCGCDVLGKIPALGEINTWANFHHEKLSGKGYPFHLSADRIPFESRIVAVADVFTALTEDRPYRKGMSREQTGEILRAMIADGSLEPELVGIAARCCFSSRTRSSGSRVPRSCTPGWRRTAKTRLSGRSSRSSGWMRNGTRKASSNGTRP